MNEETPIPNGADDAAAAAEAAAAAVPPVPPPPPAAPETPAAPAAVTTDPAQPAWQQPGYGQQANAGQANQAGYAPPPPAQGSPEQLLNNVNLNYWLSVFFMWIPALIFYMIDKGKNPLVDKYNADNLNFAILRTIVMIAGWVLVVIPVLGALIAFAANVAGFVLHLLVAAKAKERFMRGEEPGFKFNIPIVK